MLRLSEPLLLELRARKALVGLGLVPVEEGWYYVPPERLGELVELLVGLGYPPGFVDP